MTRCSDVAQAVQTPGRPTSSPWGPAAPSGLLLPGGGAPSAPCSPAPTHPHPLQERGPPTPTPPALPSRCLCEAPRPTPSAPEEQPTRGPRRGPRGRFPRGAQTHLPLPGKPAPCQPSGLRPGRPLITAHACERGDAGRPHAVAALNYDSINPPAHISRASGVHRTPCQAPRRSCTASRSAPARNARPSFSQACKTPSAFLNYENIEV